MATPAKIREQAAKRLGILGEGITLSSDKSASLDASYVEVYAELDALNLAIWDFEDEVPDEFVPWVVTMVAYNRINDYPTPNDRYKRIAADNSVAIPNIRVLQGSNAYKTPRPNCF